MTSAERLTNLNQLRWDDLGTSLRRAKLPTERWDPISVKLPSSSSCKAKRYARQLYQKRCWMATGKRAASTEGASVESSCLEQIKPVISLSVAVDREGEPLGLVADARDVVRVAICYALR